MSDADCTPGREPRSVAASYFLSPRADCCTEQSEIESRLYKCPHSCCDITLIGCKASKTRRVSRNVASCLSEVANFSDSVVYLVVSSAVKFHHRLCHQSLRCCWPDCKPSLSVCLYVSDRHFYPSTLTDFDETWSQ